MWRNTTNNNGSATLIAADDLPPYDDFEAVPGLTYYYWIKGCAPCGCNTFGSSDSGRVDPPDSASSVSAEDGEDCNQVRVVYSGLEGDSFEIWRNTSNNSNTAELVGVTDETFDFYDVTAVPGVVYYYWVKATNSCGYTSDFDDVDTGYANVPPAVTQLDIREECDYIYLYNINEGFGGSPVDHYEIWRNEINDLDGAQLIGTSTARSYKDYDVVAGATYYYWLRTVDDCGNPSPYNAPRSYVYEHVSSNVTGVTATDGDFCDLVRVSWDNVFNNAMYEIWRNTSDNNSTATLIGTRISSPFDDVGAIPETRYYYWVKVASSDCGPSGFGFSTAGYGGLPSKVTGVMATDGTDCDKVQVSWTPISGASQYVVWRGKKPRSNKAVQIATVPAGPYDDVGAEPGAIYYYWITAMNGCGNGAQFSDLETGYRMVCE